MQLEISGTGLLSMKTRNCQARLETEEKQAGADITDQLQFRPMLYTLYIDINVRVVKMLHTEHKQQITK